MASFLQKSLKLIDSSLSQSSRDPKTRYLSLNEGLALNTKILIDGRVAPASSKYEINLYCGSVVSDELIKSGNIALHFFVNPSGGWALLNSRTGKTWGQEERTPRGRLPRPLLQNQSFRLCIEVERNQYRIDVNENQFVTFLHRHPFQDVALISYYGDFDLENVQIHPAAAVQAPVPMLPLGMPGCYPNNDHVLYDVKFPKLPLLLPIKPGLSPGMMITVDGRVTGNRFDVSFYQGSNPYGDTAADVAFHMEIYMNERIIVRNSNQANQWRESEKEITHFPFFGHSAFQLVIRVEGNRYQVNVGGRYVFDFYHRVTALNTIDHLCVHGSVELHSLTVSVPPL